MFTSVSREWSLCPHQITMTILAMFILIASRAITIINTIVDGTIMVIGITIMVIGITFMVIGITFMVMDDRWIDLNNFRRGAGTS
jgi:hypothetical protein